MDYSWQLLSKSSSLLNSVRNNYFNKLWLQSIGFAGCKIIRRIIGIAHVEDFESLNESHERSEKEKLRERKSFSC